MISFKCTFLKEAKYISRVHYFVTLSLENCNVHFRITKKTMQQKSPQKKTLTWRSKCWPCILSLQCVVYPPSASHTPHFQIHSLPFPSPISALPFILSFSPSLIRFLVGFAKSEVRESFQKMENERSWIHLPLDLPWLTIKLIAVAVSSRMQILRQLPSPLPPPALLAFTPAVIMAFCYR